MTAIAFPLDPWNDLPSSAPAFMKKFMFLAKNVDSGLEYGILHTLLDPAIFEANYGEPPTIYGPLGPEPERIGNEAQALLQSRKDDWNERRKRKINYGKALSAAQTALVGALSEESLTKALDGEDIATITLIALVNNFNTKIITKKDAIEAHQAQLDKAFVAGDKITTHINTHIVAHRAFRDHNEHLSPLAKYMSLTKSLKTCGLFKEPLYNFAIKLEEEQTFEALAAAAQKHILTDSFVEANANGYANAVAAAAANAAAAAAPIVAVPTQLETFLSRIENALAAVKAPARPANVTVNNRPVRTPKPRAPRGQPAPAAATGPASVPTHYCWTHGHNFSHSGAVGDCWSPAARHDPDATAAHPNGGSQRVLNK